MGLDDTVICHRCGQLAPKRESLGLNGAWLCGKCLQDRTVLDEFLVARMRMVRHAVLLARRGR